MRTQRRSCAFYMHGPELYLPRGALKAEIGSRPPARAIPLPGEFVQAARVGGPSRGLRPCDATTTIQVVSSHRLSFIHAPEQSPPHCRSQRAEFSAKHDRKIQTADRDMVRRTKPETSAGHVRSSFTDKGAVRPTNESWDGIEAAGSGYTSSGRIRSGRTSGRTEPGPPTMRRCKDNPRYQHSPTFVCSGLSRPERPSRIRHLSEHCCHIPIKVSADCYVRNK